MAISYSQATVGNTAIKIANSSVHNRTFAVTFDTGKIFLDDTSAVTPSTGFPVYGSTVATLIPIPENVEVWAIAAVQSIDPVEIAFTIIDAPLSDAELRATPLIAAVGPPLPPLVPSAPSNVTVGTTSLLLLAANANRKGLIIGVLGTGNIVSLGLNGATAVANKGIVLRNAGQDVWAMDHYSFTTGAINAVANGAGTVVTIQEFS